MEHQDLIAEMTYIEKLSTQERLKLARQRRLQQLKKCQQKDRELTVSKREKTAQNEARKNRRGSRRKIKFVSSVKLLEAAARNDIEEVRLLLEMRVDPDSTNEDGLTALHQCCIDDSEEMMRLLVHHNASVNAQDSEKWTPLHAAATCGHLHLAKFLIANGANLLAVNADGNMPYDICEDDATLDYIESEMARRGVTQSLIDDTRSATETVMLEDLRDMKTRGQSLMYRDFQQATALHVAAANGYVRVVEYLLSQNVPTEVRDIDDWSPLHAAACWGHPDVLELLVQNGANLHARTKNQETPYDICEDPELRERIMQLINEQETKRLNSQHRRIRRAHSNTRTQSVRRTSIREKNLTPKKEAQDEARMRLQLDCNQPKLKEETPSLDENIIGIKELLEPQSITNFPTVMNATTNSSITKDNHLLEEDEEGEEEEEEDDVEENKDVDKFEIIKEIIEIEENQNEIQNSSVIQDDVKIVLDVAHPITEVEISKDYDHTVKGVNLPIIPDHKKRELPDFIRPPPIPPPRSSSTVRQETTASPTSSNGSGMVSHSGEGGSKIDIHVTVTVNPNFAPGTLADLKKQRALSRATQSSSYTLSGASSTYSLPNGNNPEFEGKGCPPGRGDFSASSVRVDTISFRPPPSPSLSPRRFCGEPTDIIGNADGQSCCIIM